ncbi:MAG: hypothetical protein II870_03385 [Synergistaceae bacterium]|nr:hypothetical protein [Synergistaceae bacterium]MBQ7569637.1 hypothetical protein [Synergistaceae bacterium]MBR0220503.1 hypothetical protein [Synergistaceae bacterium]
MHDALEDALKLYPEFKIKVLYENNKIVSVTNDEPVPLFKGMAAERVLGSDNTNGYLFYVDYEDKRMRFSYYHALSDAHGVEFFLNTVFINYAKRLGLELNSDDAKLLSGKARLSIDGQSDKIINLDPYGMSADEKVLPSFKYNNPGAAAFKNTNSGRELNVFEIECSVKQILSKAKELKAKVSTMLISMIATAAYNTGTIDQSKPVITMLPVDLRKHLGISTMVNFSDGITMPLMPEDMSLSLSGKAAKLKEFMDKQITRENFIKTITDKVNMVKNFEADSENIIEIRKKREAAADAPGAFRPFTCAFTYPGIMNSVKYIDQLFSDFHTFIYTRANYVRAYSYNDKFRLVVDRLSDDASWAENILDILKSNGLDAVMRNLGKRHGDLYSLKNLVK